MLKYVGEDDDPFLDRSDNDLLASALTRQQA